MFQQHPVRPIFYTLPKIHKSCIEHVPGRPIVAGNQSLMEPISQFIDLHIKQLVYQLPSYLEDTTGFLNKISCIQDLHENHILCTMDIINLCTTVPHHDNGLLITLKEIILPPLLAFWQNLPSWFSTKITSNLKILFPYSVKESVWGSSCFRNYCLWEGLKV